MAINDTPKTHAACADGSCWADIEAKVKALSDYRAIIVSSNEFSELLSTLCRVKQRSCCAQAWYTCDECDALLQSEGSALLNAMQQAHERIHRLDDRPVLHVYGGVVPYHHKGEPRGPWTALVNSADVVGFDAYPFGACKSAMLFSI